MQAFCVKGEGRQKSAETQPRVEKEKRIDWCCLYRFSGNSPVALLEALFARYVIGCNIRYYSFCVFSLVYYMSKLVSQLNHYCRKERGCAFKTLCVGRKKTKSKEMQCRVGKEKTKRTWKRKQKDKENRTERETYRLENMEKSSLSFSDFAFITP